MFFFRGIAFGNVWGWDKAVNMQIRKHDSKETYAEMLMALLKMWENFYVKKYS